MPHDKNGHLLAAGDLVNIPARVKEVCSTDGDGYCNVSLETVEPMFPADYKSAITLNAKQVEFVAHEELPAEPPAAKPSAEPENESADKPADEPAAATS